MRKNFINEAIFTAEKSSLNVANHGAIVIYRGKIVGRGFNKYCIENVNKVNRWSIHAEVDAINNALRKISKDDLTKSTLIVVRKLKEGTQIENTKTLTTSTKLTSEEIGYSEPCKHCANFIIKNKLRACYYS
jgi:tRNA(Arg) A34 adenosine deaminase TadA